MSRLRPTIIGDCEVCIQESLAEVLPVGDDTGVKPKVLISSKLVDLYMRRMSQDRFCELLRLPSQPAFAVALPTDLRGVYPRDPNRDARAKDRWKSWEGEGAGIPIVAPVEKDDLRGRQGALASPLRG